MNITGLSSIQQGILTQSKPVEKESGLNFRDVLIEALQNVNHLEKESDILTDKFIKGETDSIHSVLIAAEKASIALDMIIQVRNKIIDAYNEIMRMQV
jgi:flagellar hook-basal body complex protein FliE